MLRQNPACTNQVFLPFFCTPVFSERLSPALWSLQFLFLRLYVSESHLPSLGFFFDFFFMSPLHPLLCLFHIVICTLSALIMNAVWNCTHTSSFSANDIGTEIQLGLKRSESRCKQLILVWLSIWMYVSTVWVMIHGRTVAATYQPGERQRHPESSSLILTLGDVQIHTRRKQFLTSTVIVVYVCVESTIPGGTPVEMVEDVTTPCPAAVSAATWIVYLVVEFRPVSWYCRVELGKDRSTRLDSTPGTSHHNV